MMLMAFSGIQAFSSKKRQIRELGSQLAVGQRMLEVGGNLERSELALRMQEELLASTEQATANAEQLREVLASQNVLAAARGVRTGAGTTKAIANKSISAHTSDENARKLALKFKEFNIANMQRVSQLNQVSSIYNLQSNTRQQMNAVRDRFKEKLIDMGGGLLSSFTSQSSRSTLAPVEKSVGIDMAQYRRTIK